MYWVPRPGWGRLERSESHLDVSVLEQSIKCSGAPAETHATAPPGRGGGGALQQWRPTSWTSSRRSPAGQPPAGPIAAPSPLGDGMPAMTAKMASMTVRGRQQPSVSLGSSQTKGTNGKYVVRLCIYVFRSRHAQDLLCKGADATEALSGRGDSSVRTGSSSATGWCLCCRSAAFLGGSHIG